MQFLTSKLTNVAVSVFKKLFKKYFENYINMTAESVKSSATVDAWVTITGEF